MPRECWYKRYTVVGFVDAKFTLVRLSLKYPRNQVFQAAMIDQTADQKLGFSGQAKVLYMLN